MSETELIEYANTPTPAEVTEVAEKVTAVSMMENGLATFMMDIFDQVRKEDALQSAIDAELIAQLPNMKPNELIALKTSTGANKNDLVSKVVSPTMQLMAAAQQNELNERREAAKEREATKVISQSNIRQVTDMAPSEVLVGLQALFNYGMAVQKNPKQINNDTIVDAKVEIHHDNPGASQQTKMTDEELDRPFKKD